MDHTQIGVVCKYCRKRISFIKKGQYNWIPVEPELIIVKEDDKDLVLIMANGERRKGFKAGEAGHKRHTCFENNYGLLGFELHRE